VSALAEGELLVALGTHPDRVAPATHVRGTVLVASYELVLEDHRTQAYAQALDSEFRDVLPPQTALSWMPMNVSVAHYRAMNAAFPDPAQQVRNGVRSSERVQNAHIRTIIRGLRATGQLSPETLLKRAPSFFGRFVSGGGVQVIKTGPKDARVEFYGIPLLAVPYVRYGWQGMFESALGLLAYRCYVKQDPRFRRGEHMALLCSWV
jgi:hypothetical protein